MMVFVGDFGLIRLGELHWKLMGKSWQSGFGCRFEQRGREKMEEHPSWVGLFNSSEKMWEIVVNWYMRLEERE